jgi:hypothetical protein
VSASSPQRSCSAIAGPASSSFSGSAAAIDVLAVHLALDRMSAEYPRHADAVELMFFGGSLRGAGSPATPP